MRTSLSSVDASWLRMDDPANLMVVTGVLVFERPASFARLQALVRERLLRFSRFRSRVVPPPGGVGLAAWEEVSDFSLDHHLTEVELEAPGGEAELQRFVSELLSRPFEPGRPLWRCYFVPHYLGGSALVSRIHHCIGDGFALVHVLLSMADGAPPIEEGHVVRPPDGHGAGLFGGLGHALSHAAERAVDASGSLLHEVKELIANPGRLAGAAHAGLEVSGQLASLVHLLALPPDPQSAFKGPLAARKAAAWSRPFLLADFKAIGRSTGSTVNDILMAALAGGLRRYLLGRGGLERGFELRSVQPVNLRRPGEAEPLGNRFGLVFLALPLGLEDPLDRLFEVRRRMRLLTQSPQAEAIYSVLVAMGGAPQAVFDLLLGIFGSKGTAVVTNVVGPPKQISVAGVPLGQSMFWVPSAGPFGLGISLQSYAGQVWLGIQSDTGLVPDPQGILEGFADEVAALQALRAEAAGG
jgi:WS/DGAT/MGAT family acyltransferase